MSMRSGLPSYEDETPRCPACNDTGYVCTERMWTNEYGDFIRDVDVQDCDECRDIPVIEVEGDR